jgi:hypothetical protein
MRAQDLLSDIQNERMLHERCRVPGTFQEAAKALGVLAVEISLAERSLLKAQTQIIVKRSDQRMGNETGDDAIAVGQQFAGPVASREIKRCFAKG